MSFRIKCVECGEPYKLREAALGKRIRCKVCGMFLETNVPTQSATPAGRDLPPVAAHQPWNAQQKIAATLVAFGSAIFLCCVLVAFLHLRRGATDAVVESAVPPEMEQDVSPVSQTPADSPSARKQSEFLSAADRRQQLFQEMVREELLARFSFTNKTELAHAMRSVKAARRLRDEFEPLSEKESDGVYSALYFQAALYGRLGLAGESLAVLREAIDVQSADAGSIESDESFRLLRDRSRFKTTIQQLKEKNLQALQQELRSTKPRPMDFAFRDLSGDQISPADYRGQILMIECGATWCPACRKMTPNLVRLQRNRSSTGLQIVALNYERERGAAARKLVEDSIQQYQINFPCAILESRSDRSTVAVRAFPTLYVLDRQGQLRLKRVGYQSYWMLETIVATLSKEPADKTL